MAKRRSKGATWPPGTRLRILREYVAATREDLLRHPDRQRRPKNRPPWGWDTILERGAQIVDDRLRQSGIESSLRYLFYRLVTEELLGNLKQDYDMLAKYRAEARRARRFPRLVDHNRKVWRPAAYPGLNEQLAAEANRPIDRDANQPYAIYVVVEKQTVAESVKAWVTEYGIPVVPLRGYSSQTFAEDVADDAEFEANVDAEAEDTEVATQAAEVSTTLETERRPCVLLTVGDFDASGDHLMRLFYERTGGAARWHLWVPVGVTFEQATGSMGLPKAPAKATDPRLRGFAERYWPEDYWRLVDDMRDQTNVDINAKLAKDVACQIEVEALEAAATEDDPEPLRTLLMAAIRPYWNQEKFQEQLAKERRNQAILTALSERSDDDIEVWLGLAA